MRPETPFLKQVREDFANALLNTDEFGRVCSWNGHPLQIAESANLAHEHPYGQGVNAELRRIVCRDIDLDPHPVAGESVMFDGEPWFVTDVKPLFGHLTIALERHVA